MNQLDLLTRRLQFLESTPLEPGITLMHTHGNNNNNNDNSNNNNK